MFATFLMTFIITNLMAQKYLLGVGTYTTNSASKGIYLYEFDSKTGKFTFLNTTEAFNPSYLHFTDNGKFLYVANEDITDAEKGKGAVSAYKLDEKTHQLEFLNSQPSIGGGPCFVNTDKKDKNVIIANYGGGSLVTYKLAENGEILDQHQLVQHEGKGPNVNQYHAHVHSAWFSPNQKNLYVVDLGIDKVFKYNFNPSAEQPVSDGTPPFFKVPDGYGPRHLTFSPNGRQVYVLNELESKLIAFDYNNGDWKEIQTLSTTDIESPDHDKGSSAIKISNDGKFVYASNRGKTNTISIFKVLSDGKLELVENVSVKLHPRDITLTPDGNWLLSASRDQDAVELFKVDKKTGKITKSSEEISIPKPICVVFTTYK